MTGFDWLKRHCQAGRKPGPIARTIVPNSTVQCDLPPNQHPNVVYSNNKIKTTKYTIFTFVPINFFEQLHRWANLYFIAIVCLNFVPAINAFGKEVAMLPVLFVMGVTGLKDMFEDYRRHTSDRTVNRQQCYVYDRKSDKYEIREWQDIRAGDIVHLSCNEVIPADILLLHSSDKSAVCYIETSNLDGESNLKQRQVIAGLHKKFSFHPMEFKCEIECEPPNTELYKFNGSVILPGDVRTPVSKDNLLLRGCTLRNTDFVEGIVVYAGHETKALLNNRGPRYKRSKLERQINKDVIWCVVLLVVMCTVGAIGHGLWLGSYSNIVDVVFLASYKEYENDAALQGFLTFWTHVIILQVMIPLPMYVTIEVVKLGQVFFINQDLEMYHEPTNKRVECKALNITEDLGQIEYIFSDKTGTLTENRMVFRCCSIGGKDYSQFTQDDDLLDDSCLDDTGNRLDKGEDEEEEFTVDEVLQEAVSHMSLATLDSVEISHDTRRIQDFFISMAICNTVVVSSQPHADKSGVDKALKGKNGSVPNGHVNVNGDFSDTEQDELGVKSPSVNDEAGLHLSDSDNEEEEEEIRLCYEAESPDELALVKAAYRYGCRLIRRTPDSVTVWLPSEGEVTFQVLSILQFDSTRKRMSVIVKYPNSSDLILLCKGADSAILNNLESKRNDFDNERLVQATKDHINQYAKRGLRTLCMAKKTLSLLEYQKWFTLFNHARCAIDNQEALIHDAACQIENDLTLIGATGIEDNLQEGVPETIESLRKAGINVWVLTGDKQETALNIAYSCKLMTPYQHVITLNAENKEEAENLIHEKLNMVRQSKQDGPEVEIRQCHRRPAIKRDYALVIDGVTLAYALDKSVEKDFLRLAEQCTSVLCCRATPIQKAAVVRLVKEHLHMTTLAIGDGANDVSMIQTADLGIGISGQEGMQAVMASDFAIARFYYLERLLLVHGHWCYDRLARMALYMFYKSAAFVFLLFWYNLYNGFSASIAVDQYYTILHNLLFTSIPPVILGIFDQDLPDKVLLAKPFLYKSGQNCKSYLPHSFWVNIIDALWQSLTCFYTCFFIYDGSSIGMAEFGTTAITGGVLLAIGVLGLETKSFMFVNWLSVGISLIFTWGFMAGFAPLALNIDPPLNPYWVFYVNFTSPLYWFGLILLSVAGLLPRLIVTVAAESICPSLSSLHRQTSVSNKRGVFFLLRRLCSRHFHGDCRSHEFAEYEKDPQS